MKLYLNLFFLLILFSCSTVKSNFTVNDSLRKIELDSTTKDIIREYRKRFKKEVIVTISYKKEITSSNNTFYLNRLSSLSKIYTYYISYYSIIDEIPIIIISKNDGFIDMNKYTEEFINLVSPYLLDDMLMKEILKDNKGNGQWVVNPNFNNLIIDHSKVWKIQNSKVIKDWKGDLIRKKIIIENIDSNIFDFYRVIKGGIDERGNGTD